MITLEMIQKKLAEAIQQSKMTQTAIAKALHVQPTQVCSYIKGRKMPALDTFANLCAILDIDPAEILCISEYNKKSVKISDSFNNFHNSGTFKL